MIERGLYMKATGVVRRIDDLGRIVIPKEIRRNFKINEGDSLEIFVDSVGIILKKYSLLDNMVKNATILVDSVAKIYQKNILTNYIHSFLSNLATKYYSFAFVSLLNNGIDF